MVGWTIFESSLSLTACGLAEVQIVLFVHNSVICTLFLAVKIRNNNNSNIKKTVIVLFEKVTRYMRTRSLV